jgi:pimeloyl-ACP methyl ester carboxylesterase
MRKTAGSPRIAFDSTPAGPNKPRVLLIMGFGMRGDVWKPQIEGLEHDHEVAWFDNRGIGESDPATGRFRMRDLAKDALSVADALGWDRFHVVGVSLGGMIAQEVALEAGARLLSLTLIATHPGGPLGVAPHAKGLKHWSKSVFGPQSGRVSNLTELLYTPSFLASIDQAALQDRMRLQVGGKPSPRTALLQLLAIIRHDTRRRLAQIRIPTLVMKPASDILVRPLHSDRLVRGIPGARLITFEDTGHGITFQRKDRVNEEIRAHVAAHTSLQTHTKRPHRRGLAHRVERAVIERFRPRACGHTKPVKVGHLQRHVQSKSTYRGTRSPFVRLGRLVAPVDRNRHRDRAGAGALPSGRSPSCSIAPSLSVPTSHFLVMP